MVHNTVCPLCSSEKIGPELKCRDHFVSGKEFFVYKCQACNFLFTQDYPEENEIGAFYASDKYISHSDTSAGLSNKLYRLSRNVMLQRKRQLIERVTGLKKGSLLDIGSGTGYFVNVMKKAGWLTKGVEISEKARNFSQTHFGLDIDLPGNISSFEENSFDCVTLWHVLEHFHDPQLYMSEIKRVLKPGSACVVALPNCSSRDAKYYKNSWAAWDVPRHLWHFSPVTFRKFAEKSGFALDSFKVLPLDVFYISQLSEKYKGSSLPFIKGILKAFIFAVLSLLNRKRSSSIIYLLRKPSG